MGYFYSTLPTRASFDTNIAETITIVWFPVGRDCHPSVQNKANPHQNPCGFENADLADLTSKRLRIWKCGFGGFDFKTLADLKVRIWRIWRIWSPTMEKLQHATHGTHQQNTKDTTARAVLCTRTNWAVSPLLEETKIQWKMFSTPCSMPGTVEIPATLCRNALYTCNWFFMDAEDENTTRDHPASTDLALSSFLASPYNRKHIDHLKHRMLLTKSPDLASSIPNYNWNASVPRQNLSIPAVYFIAEIKSRSKPQEKHVWILNSLKISRFHSCYVEFMVRVLCKKL